MMKTAVIYASLTGNTRQVAERIAGAIGADMFDVATEPDVSGYDALAVGYWVDKGTAAKPVAEFLPTVHGKKVFLFGTLGAEPDGEHADKCKANVKALVPDDNEVVGSFICQGRIDPKLIEMFKKMPAGNVHAYTERNAVRYAEAAHHPNEADFVAAESAAKQAFGL